jgi:hypothetical protein
MGSGDYFQAAKGHDVDFVARGDICSLLIFE